MGVKETFDTGDPSQNFANAIILQATTDWRKAVKYLSNVEPEKVEIAKEEPEKYPRISKALHEKESCERFFLAPWFEVLTDLDGPRLLEMLREEWDTS